jgi:hypothetical protein
LRRSKCPQVCELSFEYFAFLFKFLSFIELIVEFASTKFQLPFESLYFFDKRALFLSFQEICVIKQPNLLLEGLRLFDCLGPMYGVIHGLEFFEKVVLLF